MNTLPKKTEFELTSPPWALDFARQAWAYGLDTFQRSILFLDVLRERGERYEEHQAKKAPHVLKFDFELVMDGRKLLARSTTP